MQWSVLCCIGVTTSSFSVERPLIKSFAVVFAAVAVATAAVAELIALSSQWESPDTQTSGSKQWLYLAKVSPHSGCWCWRRCGVCWAAMLQQGLWLILGRFNAHQWSIQQWYIQWFNSCFGQRNGFWQPYWPSIKAYIVWNYDNGKNCKWGSFALSNWGKLCSKVFTCTVVWSVHIA